jgi:protein phosphatase
VITRALGNKLNVEIDLNSLEILPNDHILICTDGLSSMMDDPAILKILQEGEENLETISKKLIQLANEKGGLDNITVVLLKFAQ